MMRTVIVVGLLACGVLVFTPQASATCVQPNSVCVSVDPSLGSADCTVNVDHVAGQAVGFICGSKSTPTGGLDTFCVARSGATGGLVCVAPSGAGPGCALGVGATSDTMQYFVCN
jgi:hypothetical protein